jgi:EAL domain-containing protein (putative c-di-GMP-specific phosphodiesterase class I)
MRDVVGLSVAAGNHPGRDAGELYDEYVALIARREAASFHALRALGARISMDDFGTGYSSLSYLRSFPFDKIKIDKSFIRDLPGNSDSAAIIRAITSMGSSLGMATTAEGVETAAQLARLRAEGCTEVQGFLFSIPQPASEVPELLDRLRWRNARVHHIEAEAMS